MLRAVCIAVIEDAREASSLRERSDATRREKSAVRLAQKVLLEEQRVYPPLETLGLQFRFFPKFQHPRLKNANPVRS